MFEFQKVLSDTYEWPVEVKIPSDGGRPKTIKFIAVFNRLNKTESRNMFESAREENEDGTVATKYQTVLNEVLVDLKAKNDEGKNEILPGDIKDELLEVAGAEPAICAAYAASLNGERAKN